MQVPFLKPSPKRHWSKSARDVLNSFSSAWTSLVFQMLGKGA